jgi:hypothetical protein
MPFLTLGWSGDLIGISDVTELYLRMGNNDIRKSNWTIVTICHYYDP